MPPPPSSDPWDDDDFFDDSTLAAIAQVEQQAIAASQAPKRTGGFHHTVVRPTAGPRATTQAASAKRPPGPINTNPRVSNCGFGWEQGGKHAMRLARGLPVNGMARFNADEDEPMDVVVDEKGRDGFGSGSADDEPIYDQRKRPELRQMVEAAARQSAAAAPRRPPVAPRQVQGSQARRDAIAAALPTRAPIQRTTSANAIAGPSSGTVGRFPQRAFTRAASTGSPYGSAGSTRPSRPVNVLPPIGSQGSQPSSQGAASRKAFFELEEERRRREALEAELRNLRAATRRESMAPSRAELPEDVEEALQQIEQLRQKLYSAQGEAATAKRNQVAAESRLQAEIDKLHSDKRDLENNMRLREHEAKQRLESMKTQAVFSNHNALASASKARQQSQWPASQRGAPASPLRDRTAATPAPLLRSVKGKGRPPPPPPPPPPPRFDGLTNAFSITPTVGSTRRQKTESTTVTPKKQRRESLSPVVSPIQSQRPSTPLDVDEDVRMDWQPNFSEATLSSSHSEDQRDPKTELQHHLVRHVASSPLHIAFRNWYEPTYLRLMGYHLEAQREVLLKWRAGQIRLASVIASASSTFDELCGELALAFRDMFVALIEAREALLSTGKPVILADAEIDLLRLFASTVIMFPTMPGADTQAVGQIAMCLNIFSRSLNANTKEKLAENWASVNMTHTADRQTLLPVPMSKADRPEAVVERELGDAIAEAGEALCMTEGKSLWPSDELASTILNLTMSENAIVATRGLDLFVAASCRPEHFRQLVTKSDAASGGLTLMDRMSRFLMNGHPKFTPQQRFTYSRDVLRALAMLARSDEDAVVLMTEASILVPALAVVLHRQSSLLWGIRAINADDHDRMDLITATMLLLHHVMFPPPFVKTGSSSQMHKGVDLADPDARLFASAPPQGTALARLLTAAASTTEFNGVHNFYVSALGPIAYTNADLDDGAWAYALRPPGDGSALESRQREGAASDLSMVQYLAQDLLNAFVEGPEGDSVYEIYDGEDRPRQSVNIPDDAEVVVVSDDDDFDEEERLMHGTWHEFDE